MRLGLIALSGIRAQNAALNELGLTLPGFVERKKVVAALPSLGLLTLAGMTPRDIELEYREIEDLRLLDELPSDYDAVAISSYTAQIGEAYALADRLRAEGVTVLLGGLHVTARPDEALRHADCIIIGEAEPVWPRVVADLRAGQLAARYDARPVHFDLRHAPMPRFELLDPDRYNRLTVQTTRGCPFACEFCAASIRLSPRYRIKPVAKVVAEIRRIKEFWPHPFVEFADDNSFVNKRHAKQLLRALVPEQIRWFTETDVSVARDDELVSLLRDSGCAQLLIGFESASRNALRGLERKSDWKSRQFDFYRTAIDKLQSHGISVNGCFVLGLDGTGPECFEETLAFVRDSGLHEVQITIQTAFPGTPLYDRLLRAGRLLRPEAWEMCTLFDVNFEPDGMSVSELEDGFRQLSRDLYCERAVNARKRRFFRQLRQARKAAHLQVEVRA